MKVKKAVSGGGPVGSSSERKSVHCSMAVKGDCSMAVLDSVQGPKQLGVGIAAAVAPVVHAATAVMRSKDIWSVSEL